MPSALVVSQQVALVTAAIFAGAASGDRRLFRTQSFHYQVAQAVRSRSPSLANSIIT